MPGFRRKEDVDAGGHRGIIPEDTTVFAVCTIGDGKLINIKNGANAGRTARLYNLGFEVLNGRFKGGRFWHDFWCNIEPDPEGKEPEPFGSHMQFCDLCDIGSVYDKDGNYPVPITTSDIKELAANKFIGIPVVAHLGVETYTTKDKTTQTKNIIKNLYAITSEQMDQVRPRIEIVVAAARKRAAKRAAASGATGLDDTAFGFPPDGEDPLAPVIDEDPVI